MRKWVAAHFEIHLAVGVCEKPVQSPRRVCEEFAKIKGEATAHTRLAADSSYDPLRSYRTRR